MLGSYLGVARARVDQRDVRLRHMHLPVATMVDKGVVFRQKKKYTTPPLVDLLQDWTEDLLLHGSIDHIVDTETAQLLHPQSKNLPQSTTQGQQRQKKQPLSSPSISIQNERFAVKIDFGWPWQIASPAGLLRATRYTRKECRSTSEC